MVTVDAAKIGATDGSGNPINLRADFWSLPRPFFSGDYSLTFFGETEHTYTGPHTDAFVHSDQNAVDIDITDQFTVTKLNLLDGRSFRFRYNQFGELAEIVYPGGGVSQIDYAPYEFGSAVCEGGPTLNPQLNRRVSQRRVLSNGTTVDAVWTYARDFGSVGGTTYPRVTVEAHQETITGPLMLSESITFLRWMRSTGRARFRGPTGRPMRNGRTPKSFESRSRSALKLRWKTAIGIRGRTWCGTRPRIQH